jgi:hypothetical protein
VPSDEVYFIIIYLIFFLPRMRVIFEKKKSFDVTAKKYGFYAKASKEKSNFLFAPHSPILCQKNFFFGFNAPVLSIFYIFFFFHSNLILRYRLAKQFRRKPQKTHKITSIKVYDVEI